MVNYEHLTKRFCVFCVNIEIKQNEDPLVSSFAEKHQEVYRYVLLNAMVHERFSVHIKKRYQVNYR